MNDAVGNAMSTATSKDLYELGEMPPLGHVPQRMHASLIRSTRLGPPAEKS